MKRAIWVAIVVVLAASRAGAAAPVEEGALAKMPVKEVTVFKDGHAFVLHEGSVSTDGAGSVVLDYVPTPIVGTFWAYAADAKAKLTGVVSSRRVVSVERTALSIRELVEGNAGARVRIKEQGQTTPYEATVLWIPTRTTEELGRSSPPGTPEALPERGNLVLLKVAEGVKAVPIGRIEEMTFLENPKPGIAREEFRNVLTFKLDWAGGKAEKSAKVGMVYVQRGIRWIPNYRVEIDGKGNAKFELQATLINELADLDGVRAHLVIGVPRFAFEETPDPISLQEAVAQLSSSFRRDSRTAYAFSTAIMSQRVAPVRQARPAPEAGRVIDLGPDIAGSGKNEDLYVFTLENVTLRKGQRMVVPVAEFTLKYRDVFVLDLPFGPPPEILRRNLNNQQQAELAKLFHAPKVKHKIRLQNTATCPLTTAPALILREGRIVAQGMMTYTAVGASSDLELTTAVDISVKKQDTEAGRTPNAVNWGGHSYARVDLAGEIHLANHRDKPVVLEVSRSVLGNIDSATNEGTITHLGRHESGWFATGGYPFWWGWYNWPYWWYHFNAIGRVTWKIELEPGKSVDLKYTWHYFWRP